MDSPEEDAVMKMEIKALFGPARTFFSSSLKRNVKNNVSDGFRISKSASRSTWWMTLTCFYGREIDVMT